MYSRLPMRRRGNGRERDGAGDSDSDSDSDRDKDRDSPCRRAMATANQNQSRSGLELHVDWHSIPRYIPMSWPKSYPQKNTVGFFQQVNVASNYMYIYAVVPYPGQRERREDRGWPANERHALVASDRSRRRSLPDMTRFVVFGRWKPFTT